MKLTSITKERLVATLAFTLLAASAQADMYQQAPRPGGVTAQSTITSIAQDGTNVTLTWYGPQGTYFIESASLAAPTNFARVGQMISSDFAGSYTILGAATNNQLFRVVNYNGYVGQGGCAGCHGDKYDQWRATGHGDAYSDIAAMPPAVRQTCIPCHTVGFNQVSGFVDTISTPHLTDVGCETCHGPGGAHKYGDHNIVHPAVTIAAEICGGCHTDAHHPTLDEWQESAHAHVTGELETQFQDPVGGPSRQANCGPCHGGSVRMAMLKNYQDMMNGITNYLALPTLHDAGAYGVTCAVCHDPHSNAIERQLRNPIASTTFFSFFTGTTTVTNNGVVSYVNRAFASQYNANVQICAQCHNSRGATWQGTSRPPHHSPQYNLLIGAVQTNYLNGTVPQPSPHGLNTNGCAQCHMHPETPETITETNPAYTGHRFEPEITGCVAAGCHSTTNAATFLWVGVQNEINLSINQTVALLQQWATTKAPTNLRTKYGIAAWEFNNPGALTPAGTNTGAWGPTSSEQNAVPANIKQARFNLYLVFHDASLGVHNPAYARFLLQDANTKVTTELNAP